MMEQWEYLTRFVEARATNKEMKQFIKEKFDKKARRHSPESMIPELNQLGEEGWEIVHMEPVPRVGGKEDVQFNGSHWSNVYFVVAKRRKAGAMPVVAVRTPQQQQAPQQDAYQQQATQQQATQQQQEEAQVPPPAPVPTPPSTDEV